MNKVSVFKTLFITFSRGLPAHFVMQPASARSGAGHSPSDGVMWIAVAVLFIALGVWLYRSIADRPWWRWVASRLPRVTLSGALLTAWLGFWALLGLRYLVER